MKDIWSDTIYQQKQQAALYMHLVIHPGSRFKRHSGSIRTTALPSHVHHLHANLPSRLGAENWSRCSNISVITMKYKMISEPMRNLNLGGANKDTYIIDRAEVYNGGQKSPSQLGNLPLNPSFWLRGAAPLRLYYTTRIHGCATQRHIWCVITPRYLLPPCPPPIRWGQNIATW